MIKTSGCIKIFTIISFIFFITPTSYPLDYKVMEEKDKKYRIAVDNLEITVLNYSNTNLDNEMKNILDIIKTVEIKAEEYFFTILPDRVHFNLKNLYQIEYKGYKVEKRLPNGVSFYFDKKEKKLYYNFNGLDNNNNLVKIEGEFKNYNEMMDKIVELLFTEEKYEKKVIKEEKKKKSSGFFNPNILYLSFGSGVIFSFPFSLIGYGFETTFLEFGFEIGYIEGTRKTELDPGIYEEHKMSAGTVGIKVNYVFLNYTDMATYITFKPYYGFSLANYNNKINSFIGLGQRLFDLFFFEFGIASSNNKNSLVFGFGLFFYLDRKY